MPDIDLTRFVDAQRLSFEGALAEIAAGRKCSHWMWYVFPQVAGLGMSPTSVRYAITSVGEAEAFLAHPVLGADYRRIVDAVWHQVVEQGVPVTTLFGRPDDSKLVSSLTLFAGVARRVDPAGSTDTFVARADEILRAAESQGLARCAITERFLSA